MTGSVRKRGKTWSYYFDMGKVDGKRKKKEKGGFRTKKEAETALAKAIAEYNNAGAVFEPSEITVADYLDEWYDMYCVPNLRYRTLHQRRGIIDLHLKPAIGNYKLKSLTPTTLQKYANEISESDFSIETIKDIFSVLKTALNYAVEPLQYLQQTPMQYVRIPRAKKTKKERIVLSLDEWEILKERFKDTRYYIPILIGFYCGLRISETLALTWDDIDFRNKSISVNKQLQCQKREGETRYSFYFVKAKSKSSERSVSFGNDLLAELEKWKKQQEKNRKWYGDEYFYYRLLPDDYRDVLGVIVTCSKSENEFTFVCTSKKGKMVQPESFAYCTKVAREKLSVNFDYHSLRHTHATMLSQAGVNIRTIQERLGHSNIETTLRVYSHVTEEMKNDAADVFEKAVNKFE